MPLEKTQENLTTCQICKRKSISKNGIRFHVYRTHKMTSHKYYDIFYKTNQESKCLNCNKDTIFDDGKYRKYCSKYCANSSKIKKENTKITCLKKYGAVNPLQNNKIKEQIKESNLIKYGCINVFENDKIKENIKKDNIEKYGVDHQAKLKIFQQKRQQTCLKKYGCKNPLQNKIVSEKAYKTRHQSKPYILPSDKIVYKMGYEPQFLNYVFKNNILKEDEIDYHPDGIKYIGKDYAIHYYFPDFYIPKWNLIVEIKSLYIELLDENVNLKETTTKELGYNYIRILNNKNNRLLNFDQFLILIGIIKN